MKRVSSLPGASAPGFPLLGFCNDQEQWVATPQRKPQSRKDSRYKKTQSRRVLDSQALLLDPLQIKIAFLKKGALPRKNLDLQTHSTYNSTLFGEERFLWRCFLLFSIQPKRVDHPIRYERLVFLLQIVTQSLWLSCSKVSSFLVVAKDSIRLSSVTSLNSPSIINACGYFLLISSSLATISSLDSWSIV